MIPAERSSNSKLRSRATRGLPKRALTKTASTPLTEIERLGKEIVRLTEAERAYEEALVGAIGANADRLEALDREAFERRVSIERHVASLEPTTANDLIIFAVLLKELLDVGEASEGGPNEDEWRRVSLLVRGLIRGIERVCDTDAGALGLSDSATDADMICFAGQPEKAMSMIAAEPLG
ncbi:MAG: hypothetical protein F9K29_03320 [Hyphomicrobiaceae bacterium]|nr:MAG: hypothetical protein F9K29_03320 [Hyphomicrobiaceae bacterium]